MKTVILLGTKGLPARHGAFEQFADVFCKSLHQDFNIIVFCPKESLKSKYNINIKRHGIKRFNSPLSPVIYDLKSILITVSKYRSLNPTVFIYGYSAAPFYWILNLFNIKFYVNTDGYEYKRSKFNFVGKIYLRFCEKLAVFFAPNNIITDSSDLINYYNQRYKINPRFIAYGYDKLDNNKIEKPLIEGDYDITIMRLEPENNIKLIIEAYSTSNRKLIIVGPSTKYFNLLKKVITENIIYYGPEYDRDKLQNLRYYAKTYVHGHSVGGMNPILIEGLVYPHKIISLCTPHNHEVIGSRGLYFYSLDTLKSALNKIDNHNNENDPSLDISRFEWDTIINQYKTLIT